MNEFESAVLEELHAMRIALENLSNRHEKVELNPIADYTPIVQATGQNGSNENQSLPTLISNDVRRFFFGTPDGSGFEMSNALSDPDSPKILYVVESADGKEGHFYPLNRSFSRLRSNANTFLLPLCDVSVPIEELSNLSLSPEQYGVVELIDGYWKVIRKCIINSYE